MTFKKKENLVGKRAILTKDMEAVSGTLKAGSIVRVTDCGNRGYTIRDEEGNQLIECGFKGFRLLHPSDIKYKKSNIPVWIPFAKAERFLNKLDENWVNANQDCKYIDIRFDACTRSALLVAVNNAENRFCLVPEFYIVPEE